jgi:hypothetical protein
MCLAVSQALWCGVQARLVAHARRMASTTLRLTAQQQQQQQPAAAAAATDPLLWAPPPPPLCPRAPGACAAHMSI